MTTASPDQVAEFEAHADLRSLVVGLIDLLGVDELAVLEMVAHGLARGRETYGELRVAADRRDFQAEAAEEVRDALVYLSAELLRLGRTRRTP